MTGPVLAAYDWPSNAELIADCAALGYLQPTDRVLDPTYGKGVWWKHWRPAELVTHDIDADGIDFRKLPHEDGEFDAAVFDPPYVCVGGRTTTTIPDFHQRFGLTDAPRTPAALQSMNDDGLAEVARVVKRRGIVLAKCQDYIWSGKFFAGTHHTLCQALGLGFELVDRLERVQPHPRPQPQNRTRKHPACRGAGCADCDEGRVPTVQAHAQRNLSTLFVLRAAR